MNKSNQDKIGIDYIEFWVSNLDKSIKFYEHLFKIIGWQKFSSNGFTDGTTQIYFIEKELQMLNTIGPRHICFSADCKETVDKVGKFIKQNKNQIIRGPTNSEYKSKRSYTVDFKDPDGYILEVTESFN